MRLDSFCGPRENEESRGPRISQVMFLLCKIYSVMALGLYKAAWMQGSW